MNKNRSTKYLKIKPKMFTDYNKLVHLITCKGFISTINQKSKF